MNWTTDSSVHGWQVQNDRVASDTLGDEWSDKIQVLVVDNQGMQLI